MTKLTRKDIKRYVMTGGGMLLESFDDALVGVSTNRGVTLAVYSSSKIIKILMTKNGWTNEEAFEFAMYNIFCAYMGECTPVIMGIELDGTISDEE